MNLCYEVNLICMYARPYVCVHYQLFRMFDNQVQNLWNTDYCPVKMADKTERFESLEHQLETFIETTRQISIIVSDFQQQGQNLLNQKL